MEDHISDSEMLAHAEGALSEEEGALSDARTHEVAMHLTDCQPCWQRFAELAPEMASTIKRGVEECDHEDAHNLEGVKNLLADIEKRGWVP